MNQTASKSVLRFSLGTPAKLGSQKRKTKNHTRIICHLFAGRPTAIALNVVVRGDIENLMIYDNDLIPRILLFSIGLASRL